MIGLEQEVIDRLKNAGFKFHSQSEHDYWEAKKLICPNMYERDYDAKVKIIADYLWV